MCRGYPAVTLPEPRSSSTASSIGPWVAGSPGLGMLSAPSAGPIVTPAMKRSKTRGSM